jgi:nicotinamide-nucleotide amidase
VGEGTLETFVAQRLREQGRTVATAESCTGGAVAALLTSVSGSSAYFRGGVVAYSAEAKAAVLGVSATDIAAHGAVSEAVACQLAQGARRLLRADFAVATTGVAGPTGGTPQAPVGTVWVAVATPDGAATARLLRLGADTRPNIVARAAARALDMLREVLG